MINFNKVIKLLTVICALVAVISVFLTYILPLYLSHKFINDVTNSVSVGIIGGADGPTAVYLAERTSSPWFTIVFAVLAILGVIYLLLAKNPENRRRA
ncbi:hypothetical protein CDQ84_05715 [Clostridium thermosuccinogenes]|jgi:Na+-transporting methylmalonyl-CoA/oxaloacetate decarboxylase beta subunit|uniref:Sodium ion-translocating decarboxylase subunit beta n=1 Tax=Clostridium thermosuccinogenes TaxID=84032 RepID=A0A2K2F1B0_9CLOT|nr:sodium ion-translocating decarboxylase subunit beta [Pseudoclostridium thermosuccinogenes]AUS96763.1 hypothetical protein CDO33_10110 [Pseudoclostridium thermosuccinogenes]PNT92575.1 hypothetical protein CDQ83_03145 [Pseudoclostridium thermosuccinogenes]PNT97686.1 hypothetical protein CDQ85_07890 [Pseudoclostridium thermosuccinogenes]PNU00580.1 hypothetical protein CDQ84_05715 [Pseudoclostridium thermosuccinogenes]